MNYYIVSLMVDGLFVRFWHYMSERLYPTRLQRGVIICVLRQGDDERERGTLTLSN